MFTAFADIKDRKGAVLTELVGMGKTPGAARAAAFKAAHNCIAARRMHAMVGCIEVSTGEG